LIKNKISSAAKKWTKLILTFYEQAEGLADFDIAKRILTTCRLPCVTCVCTTVPSRPGLEYVVVQFYPWFNFYFPLFFFILIYDNEYKIKENKN